jgi:hypothetical protein
MIEGLAADYNSFMLPQDMEPGGMVFAEGFSLQDAMCVLEVRALMSCRSDAKLSPRSVRSGNQG